MPPRPNLLRRSHELALVVTVVLVVVAAPEFEAAHIDDGSPAVSLGPNFDPLPVATAAYIAGGGAHEANAPVAPPGDRFTFYR